MAKSISIAIIMALTVSNLLPAAECNANPRGGGSPGEDDFNDRVSKGAKNVVFCFVKHDNNRRMRVKFL